MSVCQRFSGILPVCFSTFPLTFHYLNILGFPPRLHWVFLLSSPPSFTLWWLHTFMVQPSLDVDICRFLYCTHVPLFLGKQGSHSWVGFSPIKPLYLPICFHLLKKSCTWEAPRQNTVDKTLREPGLTNKISAALY